VHININIVVVVRIQEA